LYPDKEISKISLDIDQNQLKLEEIEYKKVMLTLILNDYETDLRTSKKQWINGDFPGCDDKMVYQKFKTFGIEAGTHPEMFGWFNLVSKFDGKV
jgi:hypothetical protein